MTHIQPTGFTINDEPLYLGDWLSQNFGAYGFYEVIQKNQRVLLRDTLHYQNPSSHEIEPEIPITGDLYLPYLKTNPMYPYLVYGNVYCDHCGKVAGKYHLGNNFVDIRTLQLNQYGYETSAETKENQLLALTVACPDCTHHKTFLHQNKSANFYFQLLCQRHFIQPLQKLTVNTFYEAEELALSLLAVKELALMQYRKAQ